MTHIKPGIYEHYKGAQYEVTGTALLTGIDERPDLEQMVIYMGLYDSKELGQKPIFTTPLSRFLEIIEIEGKKVPRFKKVEEPNPELIKALYGK